MLRDPVYEFLRTSGINSRKITLLLSDSAAEIGMRFSIEVTQTAQSLSSGDSLKLDVLVEDVKWTPVGDEATISINDTPLTRWMHRSSKFRRASETAATPAPSPSASASGAKPPRQPVTPKAQPITPKVQSAKTATSSKLPATATTESKENHRDTKLIQPTPSKTREKSSSLPQVPTSIPSTPASAAPSVTSPKHTAVPFSVDTESSASADSMADEKPVAVKSVFDSLSLHTTLFTHPRVSDRSGGNRSLNLTNPSPLNLKMKLVASGNIQKSRRNPYQLNHSYKNDSKKRCTKQSVQRPNHHRALHRRCQYLTRAQA